MNFKRRGGVLFLEPVFDTSGYSSIYVFSETQENFLIDPNESTLKGLLGTEGIGLLRTNNILLTTLSWEKMGGLIGVLLSLKSTKIIVNIYGPPGLFSLFRNASFQNKSNNIRVYELDEHHTNELGEVFKIKTIPINKSKLISSNQTDQQEEPIQQVNNNNNNNNREIKIVPLNEPQKSLFSDRNKRSDLIFDPRLSPNICYYFETLPVATKFSIEKAKSLGITAHRKIKQLAEGHEVENDTDGSIVKPSDIFKVVEGTGFVYINCPDETYFESLFNNPIWDQFYNGEKKLTYCYHSVPKHVLNHPSYIQFMEKLTTTPTPEQLLQFENEKKEEQRILSQKIELIEQKKKELEQQQEEKEKQQDDEDDQLSNDDSTSTSTTTESITNSTSPKITANIVTGELELSGVDKRSDVIPPINTKHFILTKEFTPLQPDDSILLDNLKVLIPDLTPQPDKWEPTKFSELELIHQSEILKNNCCLIENGTKHMLVPLRVRGTITEKSVAEKYNGIPGLYLTDRRIREKDQKLIDKIYKFRHLLEENKKNNGGLEYPKMMFTGTASSIPNSYRNVSGFIISPSENNHMIVDCGQSSATQMEIFFGREKLPKILMDTHLIWVSHLHADHHLGIGSVILARNKAFKEAGVIDPPPLVILVPTVLLSWFNDFKRYCDNSVIIVGIGQKSTLLKSVCDRLSITSLTSVPVVHCHEAYGLVVTFKNEHIPNGFKLTYSGDTRPSKLLIAAGKKSDLLIHEATFTDEYLSDAISKNHSTFSEALSVAKQMEAKQTILTHFSQRYPSIIRTNKPDCFNFDDSEILQHQFSLAYDLVRFSPYQFPLLQQLNYNLDKHLTENEAQQNLIIKKKELRRQQLKKDDLKKYELKVREKLFTQRQQQQQQQQKENGINNDNNNNNNQFKKKKSFVSLLNKSNGLPGIRYTTTNINSSNNIDGNNSTISINNNIIPFKKLNNNSNSLYKNSLNIIKILKK